MSSVDPCTVIAYVCALTDLVSMPPLSKNLHRRHNVFGFTVWQSVFPWCAISLYIVERFQWNLTHIFVIWLGIAGKVFEVRGHSQVKVITRPNAVMAFRHCGVEARVFRGDFYLTSKTNKVTQSLCHRPIEQLRSLGSQSQTSIYTAVPWIWGLMYRCSPLIEITLADKW